MPPKYSSASGPEGTSPLSASAMALPTSMTLDPGQRLVAVLRIFAARSSTATLGASWGGPGLLPFGGFGDDLIELFDDVGSIFAITSPVAG